MPPPSATKKKAADARVFQQVNGSISERYSTGDEHIAEISELEALLGILLNDDDGLAIYPLQVIEHRKYLFDSPRLKPDRWLVYH